ncbi:MAG: PilZ domain-containing protein [Candidatus Omnitrophota bacterium]
MKEKLPERRRFVRTRRPLKITVREGDRIEETVTRNLSPVGVRFEVGQELKSPGDIEIMLSIPSSEVPIHITGKVVWQTKQSLEDKSPYDVGVKISRVEDKNKNDFLRYLCDLLYASVHEVRT